MDPNVQVGDTVGLRGQSWVLAEALLVIGVLIPLQIAAVVLWIAWQRRIRRNAAVLQDDNAGRTLRRVLTVAGAAIALVAAEAAAYGAGVSRDMDPSPSTTLVAIELALDVAVLGLLVGVGVTTARWTREQDKFVRGLP